MLGGLCAFSRQRFCLQRVSVARYGESISFMSLIAPFIFGDIVGFGDFLSAAVTGFGRWSSELPAGPGVSAAAGVTVGTPEGTVLGTASVLAPSPGAAARFPAPPPPEKELKEPTDVIVVLLSTIMAKRLRKVCSCTPEATTAARRIDSLCEIALVGSVPTVYVPHI